MQNPKFLGFSTKSIAIRASSIPTTSHDLCVVLFWRLAAALFEFVKVEYSDINDATKEHTHEYLFLLAQSVFLQITDHSENSYMFEPRFRRVSEFKGAI